MYIHWGKYFLSKSVFRLNSGSPPLETTFTVIISNDSKTPSNIVQIKYRIDASRECSMKLIFKILYFESSSYLVHNYFSQLFSKLNFNLLFFFHYF